jgi:3-oxoadipate enol-lactonase
MQAADALGRFSSHGWVNEIDVPTAVVVTSRDRIVPMNRQMKLAQSIPSATAHVLAADHDCVAGNGELFTATLLSACETVRLRLRSGTTSPALRSPAA